VRAAILRGRPFSVDDAQTLPVAIVNRTLARQVWGEEDVVGRRLKLGPPDNPGPWLTVVGVVADMRREGIEIAPAAQLFVPLAQAGPRLCTLLVRTTTTPLALKGQVEAAIRRVDMRVPIYGVTTLGVQMEQRLGSRRFQTVFVLVAAVVALVMAAIGIYGLVLQSVVSRTREIGIRLALGAQPRAILGMSVGDGLRLSAAGLIVGVACALIASHGARGLLFEVSASDPVTFVAVGLLLTAVATAASYVPARRALRVAPSVALRRL
jgi:putative ABC transport system permease protein